MARARYIVRYEYIEHIGHGAHAIVDKVQDKRSGKAYARKFFFVKPNMELILEPVADCGSLAAFLAHIRNKGMLTGEECDILQRSFGSLPVVSPLYTTRRFATRTLSQKHPGTSG
jgi:serine/threonine protein kinase